MDKDEALDRLAAMLELGPGYTPDQLVDEVGDLLDIKLWLGLVRARLIEADVASQLGLSAVSFRVGDVLDELFRLREGQRACTCDMDWD